MRIQKIQRKFELIPTIIWIKAIEVPHDAWIHFLRRSLENIWVHIVWRFSENSLILTLWLNHLHPHVLVGILNGHVHKLLLAHIAHIETDGD